MATSLPAETASATARRDPAAAGPAIAVERLGKRYEIFGHPADRLKQFVAAGVSQLAGRPARRYYEEFWALRDISFSVERGHTVGVVGRNGSGKSTLLGVLCGVLRPTEGDYRVNGRIAPLLQLGAGFNPEFTGRENAILSATVLGAEAERIAENLPRILEFADIGPFIDQPVKLYSSGMFARLAFAVAIHVDPDVLIVDEALAVGDEAFQRKCFARIERMRENGATILLVSHSGAAILDLCDRALLLHKGRMVLFGDPKQVVFLHQRIGNLPDAEADLLAERVREGAPVAESAGADGAPAPGASAASPEPVRFEPYFEPAFRSQSVLVYEEKGAAIRGPKLATAEGVEVNNIGRNGRYRLSCEVAFAQDCPDVRFYAVIRTTTGVDVAGCADPPIGEPGLTYGEGETIALGFEFTCYLNPGVYFASFAAQASDGSLHHRVLDAIAFRVHDLERRHATGLVDFDFRLTRSKVEAAHG